MTRPIAARAAAVRALEQAGVPNAEVDATWLVAEVLGVSPAELPLAQPLDEAQQQQLAGWLQRRCRREPLQHIVGRAAFADLSLAVGPGVFVPRPETEVLLTAALQRVAVEPERRVVPESERRVAVDLCAGSGALALALALGMPGSRVYAVEVDDQAAVWLQRNVAEYDDRLRHVGSSVTVVVGDATADPLPELHARVDVVVSNPPYIPDGFLPRDPEVADYDPHRALYGGPNGLDVARGVVATAARLLRPGGWLLVEHGDDQGWHSPGRSMPQLLAESGNFCEVDDLLDLAGRPRVAFGKRGLRKNWAR